MSRRSLDKRNVRKLTRTGGGRTISVTIPIEIVRELGWKSKQKVVVTKRGSEVTIRDWQK